MKKLLLALIAIALIAAPAMASVQNVKVSGDVDNTLVIRENFDFAGSSQSDLIMQTRLRVDADLTDKVSATIALINEREWAANNSDQQDNVDLNLAFVTMKEMLYSPLTVTLGRQEFAFGNSFVIDSAGTNNLAPTASGIIAVADDLTKQTAQDAVRLTLDYDPLTIDLLYSAINQGATGINKLSNDINLYGINVGYEFNDEKATMVEGYVWYKDDNSTNSTKTKVIMPGVRGSMNVLDGWNLQAEAAYQMGDMVLSSQKLDRKAYAGQILSNYMLPFEKTKKYQPVFGLSYTMYSGDTSPSSSGGGDDDYTAWDPMYENQAGGKIANTLFNATNSHTLGASLAFVPMDDVQANVYYDRIWMDKKLSSFSLVQPNSTGTATPGQEAEESELGQEVGLVLNYDYTEDVQIGANLGWFFPGDHYDNDSETASQILLNAKVAF